MNDNDLKLNKKLIEVIRDENMSAEIRLKMVKYWARLGVNVNARADDGRTVLEIAKSYGRDDCVMILEEAQKKVSAQKTKGDKTSGALIVKANEGR